jgi:hypothetical protein
MARKIWKEEILERSASIRFDTPEAPSFPYVNSQRSCNIHQLTYSKDHQRKYGSR